MTNMTTQFNMQQIPQNIDIKQEYAAIESVISPTLVNQLPQQAQISSALVKTEPQIQSPVASAPKLESPAPVSTPKPKPYIPLARVIDTYGGLDLKTLKPFLHPHSLPAYPPVNLEWHDILMSLRSSSVFHITSAINILLTASSSPDINSTIIFFENEPVYDALMSLVDDSIALINKSSEEEDSPSKKTKYSHQLISNAYNQNDVNNDPIEVDKLLDVEGQTIQAISSIFVIFRNLSFLPKNQKYLSKDTDFIGTLLPLLTKVQNMDLFTDSNWLELRRNFLIIISNIMEYYRLAPTDETSFKLIEFISECCQDDSEYYSKLALESLIKLAVQDINSMFFNTVRSKNILSPLYLYLTEQLTNLPAGPQHSNLPNNPNLLMEDRILTYYYYLASIHLLSKLILDSNYEIIGSVPTLVTYLTNILHWFSFLEMQDRVLQQMAANPQSPYKAQFPMNRSIHITSLEPKEISEFIVSLIARITQIIQYLERYYILIDEKHDLEKLRLGQHFSKAKKSLLGTFGLANIHPSIAYLVDEIIKTLNSLRL